MASTYDLRIEWISFHLLDSCSTNLAFISHSLASSHKNLFCKLHKNTGDTHKPDLHTDVRRDEAKTDWCSLGPAWMMCQEQVGLGGGGSANCLSASGVQCLQRCRPIRGPPFIIYTTSISLSGQSVNPFLCYGSRKCKTTVVVFTDEGVTISGSLDGLKLNVISSVAKMWSFWTSGAPWVSTDKKSAYLLWPHALS